MVDDQTLRIETDASMQTRLLHFGSAPPAIEDGWQGYSAARWERPTMGVFPTGLGLGLASRGGTRSRSLEVVTTHLRPGYLRKNGVPFSADAKLTEYFDWFKDPDGTPWFVVTSIVEDPMDLNAPWVTTSHFKQLKDGALWHRTPSAVR